MLKFWFQRSIGVLKIFSMQLFSCWSPASTPASAPASSRSTFGGASHSLQQSRIMVLTNQAAQEVLSVQSCNDCPARRVSLIGSASDTLQSHQPYQGWTAVRTGGVDEEVDWHPSKADVVLHQLMVLGRGESAQAWSLCVSP